MPTIHKYRMDWPQKVKVGSTIMVCTDGDLFGPWVPEDWILQVFAAAEMAPQHQYIFLTQYPVRYQSLANHGKLPMRENFWYGTTATVRKDGVWANSKYNTFVAIEPLLGPFEGDATKVIRELKWIVIGAEYREGHSDSGVDSRPAGIGRCDRNAGFYAEQHGASGWFQRYAPG